jgi:hypothetical protein
MIENNYIQLGNDNFQLFSKIPEYNVLDEIEKIYPISGFRKRKVIFTKDSMNEFNTFEKIKTLIPILKKYYMPCKQKIFLNYINFRKSLTILRQILRVFGFSIKHKERFIQYRKQYEYWIVYDKEMIEKRRKKNMKKKVNIVTFD